ncbi:Hypothetical predicted protein [Paramuricea clavata]|uniref:Uncharacterized protein n=1 Tax=Paramuricea clavata TaxID=317549 RepID=A0A7D9EL69_PARCT|nr:Hypothetical predicted protein [Paramuricea clavata]
MVYRVDFEADNPDLSCFQDATLQEIRAAVLTDPEKIEVQALVESGWPAQKVSVLVPAQQYCPTPFWRVLRSNLPQPSSTLLPSTPPHDIVVKDQTERKSQQKRAYDKRAGPPLPHLLPETKVFAKPPPTSSAKAWIPGKVIGSAGPRSYIINTGASHIRRNRTQI